MSIDETGASRIGLISDIHGNRLALEAVVADGRQAGVDAWWVLGDLVAIGPEPVETLELLVELPGVRFVRGNTDRYVVSGERPPPHAADVALEPSLAELFDTIEASFSWTRAAIDDAGWLAWLAQLGSEQRTVLPDGCRVLGIHASPASDDGVGITPGLADDDLLALVGDADADLVLGGHTHQPTDRWAAATRAINLGSVSNPITDDLRASYVVLDVSADGHRLMHRGVAYDHEEVVRRTIRSGHPATDYICSFQRGDQIRFPMTAGLLS